MVNYYFILSAFSVFSLDTSSEVCDSTVYMGFEIMHGGDTVYSDVCGSTMSWVGIETLHGGDTIG